MVRKSRCAFLLVLWCLHASADVALEFNCDVSSNRMCETLRLSTTLGSSVLLPCNCTPDPHDAASWSHFPNVTVVTVNSSGRINFFDPRFGRIHAFPNQGSLGNYSISIDNIKDTDLGCYRCLSWDKCVLVDLALKTESDIWLFPFYIYIITGVATFIVLSVGCFLCVKCILLRNDGSEENYNITIHDANDDSSYRAQEMGRVSGDGHPHDAHHPGSASHENPSVYENDIHGDDEPDYLNEMPAHCNMNREEASHSGQFVRGESQRTKQRFHTELFTRLRQASMRKHQYVNQDELHKQLETVSKKGTHQKKAELYRQYPNPIYNRSPDSLDQM